MIHLCGNTFPDTPWIWPPFAFATAVYLIAVTPPLRRPAYIVWGTLGVLWLLSMGNHIIDTNKNHHDICEPTYMIGAFNEILLVWIGALITAICVRTKAHWPKWRYVLGLIFSLALAAIAILSRDYIDWESLLRQAGQPALSGE